jgi:membrane complex biogenesis BtpA family protein
MNKLKDIFQKDKNIIIGVIHFSPLLGYNNFPGFDVALKNASEDLNSLKEGGADGVIFENNYDIPHRIFVEHEIVASMIFLIQEIKKIGPIDIPFGISVLWNDYGAALAIAKVCGAKFIRVPVFVDSVNTQYGKIIAEPEKVISFRKKIKATNIALFTDIHVKHAKMLEEKSIAESAKEATDNGSDSIIITGEWTGDAPDISDLKEARETVGPGFPILVGSGADENNMKSLIKYANGAIISTSLKTGVTKEGEVNIKSYEQRIDKRKVKNLLKQL